MKKLMIAAAAAAMVGGAYATTGCEGCTTEETTQKCNVSVYNLKFTLKSLANKSAKNGECTGYYYEQGTRTIDGLLWSCCEDCDNWLWNQSADETDWQYCLWEKKNARVFTQGIEHQNYDETADSTWAAVGTYTLAGENDKTITTAYYTTKALAFAALPATIVTYGPDGTTVLKTWTRAEVAYLEKKGETTTRGRYVDTEPGNIFAVRYSKNAKKVAMNLQLNTAADLPISNAGLTTTAGDGGIASAGAGLDYIQIYACGFGSYAKDGDIATISSLNGNCAGEMTAYFCEDAVCGCVDSMCDDDFENWCNSGWQQADVPVSGTWSIKYVKKLSKGFAGAVPSFARNFVE